MPQNSNSNDRPRNNDRDSNDRILNHLSGSPTLQQNRRSAGDQAHGERTNEESTRHGAWALEPCVLLEPEDVPIPDADDLVIEILIDQMNDFDEGSTDALEIFAVTCGDKKRVWS